MRRKSLTSVWRRFMSSTKKTPEHSRRAYDLLAMAAATVTAAAAATVTAAAAAEAAAVTATAPTVTAATVTATAVEAARAVAEAVVAAWGFGGEVAAAVAGVQAATGAGGTASESGAIIEHNKCRGPTPYFSNDADLRHCDWQDGQGQPFHYQAHLVSRISLSFAAKPQFPNPPPSA
jgi:hypothetical protein